MFSYPVLDILRELTVRIWVFSSISIGLVVSPVEESSCGLLNMASIAGHLTLSVFLRRYAAAAINRQVKGLYWLFLLLFRLCFLLKWLLCVRGVNLLRMRLLHLLLLGMGLWRMWLWNMSAMSTKELLVAITKTLALNVKALLLA